LRQTFKETRGKHFIIRPATSLNKNLNKHLNKHGQTCLYKDKHDKHL